MQLSVRADVRLNVCTDTLHSKVMPMVKTHKVSEVIRMVDGTLKVFEWYSDDKNAIDLYFESRSIDEVERVLIDNVEYSRKEADKIILEYERQLI